MDPLIQSALTAAQQGDKSKTIELLSPVLEANPDNIEALLILAGAVGEATRKRQILNRVLSLDPTNKTARDTMLEMDRAEISAHLSQPAALPVASQQNVLDGSLKKPRVFRFSQTGLIILYVFTSISCCATFWFAAIDMNQGFPFLAMGLVLGLTVLTLSSQVELNETGIKTSSFIGSAEIKWNEIASIKTNPLKGILELKSDIGGVVNISTQIKGYREILDTLRLQRPDLFPQGGSTALQPAGFARSPLNTYQQPGSTTSSATRSKPAISASISLPEIQSALIPKTVPEQSSSPRIQVPAEAQKEKKLTFAFPLFWRIFMYAFPVLFGCLGVLVAIQNVRYGLPLLALAAVLGLIALAFSPKVEISETSIRASGMLDSMEAQWGEIVQMKSNPWKRTLELSKSNGEIVAVSTQVSGYPRIVEIVRQKRPDLFRLETQPVTQDGSPAATRIPGSAEQPLAFTGLRVFKKNATGQYGVILLMTPLFLVGAWLLMSLQDKFAGVGIILVALFFVVMALFTINQIKVEPDKITLESFFVEKEYRAKEIREINMKTVRSRHGIATNFVNIQPVEGRAVSLAGFPEGNEVLYAFLHEWWETYRNR